MSTDTATVKLETIYRCPDCGAGVHLVLDVVDTQNDGTEMLVTITGDGADFTQAFLRHARFNPDLHPWLADLDPDRD